MTFDLDQLAGNLTSFILVQLVKPLLGLSSSLLGLLKSAASDKASLASQLESAIDRDGGADFRQEGRACNQLFQGGASTMLRRWEQVSSKGPKAKNLGARRPSRFLLRTLLTARWPQNPSRSLVLRLSHLDRLPPLLLAAPVNVGCPLLPRHALRLPGPHQ